MNTIIQIGRIGKIMQGDDEGSYIEIVDDKVNTGGFLILIGEDQSFAKGFDAWVENLEQLNAYFAASNWRIEWENL